MLNVLNCAHMPKACQLLIFKCQHADKCANIPKMCQFYNLVCQCAKGMSILQLGMPKGVSIFQLLLQEFFNYA